MPSSPNRRQFLRQTSRSSALLAEATSLGGVYLFKDENPAKIRLAITGCGGKHGPFPPPVLASVRRVVKDCPAEERRR